MTKNEGVVRKGYQILERQAADGFIGMLTADGTFSPDPPRKRNTERMIAGFPLALLNCSLSGKSLSLFPSSYRVIPPISASRLALGTKPVPTSSSNIPPSAEPAGRQCGEPRHQLPFAEVVG